MEQGRESVSGRIEQKNISPCKHFARMSVVLYVSETKKHRHERRKDMFGFTALVVTLIGSTVVGLGTGFAIVCATEG